MLLTIKQPAHHGYNIYSPPTPPSSSRFSVASPSALATLPTNSKSLPPLTPQPMSGPHRGLPPLNLPQSQGSHPPPPPPAISQPHWGQLPAPPQQWQGAEEPMRNWLHAKAEEDKRKQEEEKTRQETLRLEQRKIEQDMLRTSLSGGIPPYMVPMVFAGMGGGNLPNASLEWAQHYMAEAHHFQQQQQVQRQPLLPSQGPTSPEQVQRRDSRAVAPPYSQQHPGSTTIPSTPIGPGGTQQGNSFLPNYQTSPASRSRQPLPQSQGVIARPLQTSHLPRLNTGEMLIQPPPPGPSSIQILSGHSSHPLQQSQSAQQQESQSSPSIYFHHWQPPVKQAGTSTSNNQPTTPSDHTSSPKKRKATGPQQPAPPPTQYTSPPYSSSVSNTPSSRRRGHSRQRSDMSSRGLDTSGRPTSRHRQHEGFTSGGLNSPSTHPPSAEHSQTSFPVAELSRRRSGGSNPISSLLDQSDLRPRSQSHSQPQSQHVSQSQAPPPQQSAQRDTHSSEMRHETRETPEAERSRRGSLNKRDEERN